MEKRITIISTSYRSGEHLNRLFNNLVEKAQNKDSLQFLVIDNTNGEDKELNGLFPKDMNLEIIENDGRNLQRSISHSNALDIGLKESGTEFTLIIDPDVHIFKDGWDRMCLDLCENAEKLVVGAPYPDWKLGKVHDYPSVVFFFFQTRQIRDLNRSFYPFPSLMMKLKNSFFRKITRLGILASKNRLNNSLLLRKITIFLERNFGITSPDTGKDIIEAIREQSFKPVNFKAYYGNDLETPISSSFQFEMAKEFELYFHNKDPFLTHMYGSGVFHWKTAKGSDIQYWRGLIENIEREIR